MPHRTHTRSRNSLFPAVPGTLTSVAFLLGRLGNATTIVAKFRQGFSRQLFPALRQQGVPRFVSLGPLSALRALPRVRCGVLRDALFVWLSVQHGVPGAPLGGQSAGIAAPLDDSLVLYGA